MNGGRTTASLGAQIAQLIVLAALLACGYNSFAPKRIPLIRRDIPKVAVSDSDLFTGRGLPPSDTPEVRSKRPDVKVIAPLHERALQAGDSAAPPPRKEMEMYKIITLSQLNRLLAAGHNMLVDARDSADYRKSRIKGARNIPGLTADKYFPELVPLPRDTMVLIYCNNPDCHLGRMVAEFMNAIGFKRLYLFDDGWDGWQKAKMPIDSSRVSDP